MGAIIGFILWLIFGLAFCIFGIFSFKAKKPVGFWANAEMYEVNDVKKYNKAMGKLWLTFGAVLVILGLPLLDGENSPLVCISIIGCFFDIIAIMVIYTLVITPKYRLKK